MDRMKTAESSSWGSDDRHGDCRYVVNPALVPRVWSGPSWGYWAFRNTSWANSVWLGTGWHILCLPQRVWLEVLRQSWNDPLRSPLYLLRFLGLTAAFIVLGLAGWLVMLPYPPELLSRAIVLDMEDAARDVAEGRTTPFRVTDRGKGP